MDELKESVLNSKHLSMAGAYIYTLIIEIDNKALTNTSDCKQNNARWKWGAKSASPMEGNFLMGNIFCLATNKWKITMKLREWNYIEGLLKINAKKVT